LGRRRSSAALVNGWRDISRTTLEAYSLDKAALTVQSAQILCEGDRPAANGELVASKQLDVKMLGDSAEGCSVLQDG
jgi:hypothetical protein